MEWLGKVLEFLKLPLKYVCAVAIAAAALLFLPQQVLQRLHVAKFVSEFDAYIGVVLLVSLVLAGVGGASMLWDAARAKLRLWKAHHVRLKALRALDSKEKAVLREFFLQERGTLLVPTDQPVVAGLVRSGILVLDSRNLYGPRLLRSVALAPDVERRLTPEMIDLPTGEGSEAEVRFLRSNRPGFMQQSE